MTTLNCGATRFLSTSRNLPILAWQVEKLLVAGRKLADFSAKASEID